MRLTQASFSGRHSSRSLRSQGYIIKSLLLLFLTVGFALYRLVYRMDLTRACQYDAGHQLTYGLNRSMDRDPNSIVILIGQEFMDVSLVITMIVWVVAIKNILFPMSALIFFFVRTLSLQIFILPFPEDMAWKAPHFPSLMVPYDRTRDFYFSGHTGIALLMLLQSFRLKMPIWVKLIATISLCWMIMMLVASRTHYSIDIVGGVFFAILCYDISGKVIFYSDYIWSLPYLAFQRIKHKCRGEEVPEYQKLQCQLP